MTGSPGLFWLAASVMVLIKNPVDEPTVSQSHGRCAQHQLTQVVKATLNAICVCSVSG